MTAHALLSILLAAIALAEPVQYCRYGHQKGEVDFCMGVTTHLNHTTLAHDMYLRMTVTRDSNKGWTAIGTGPEMAGSLMFIVYGDPESGEGPLLSIRTATGHQQPRLLTPTDMGGADLLVLRADWMPVAHPQSHEVRPRRRGTYVAEVAVVCFACSRWPGSPITATTGSQPWIWAWNAAQDDMIYTFDTHLDMHAHHAGNGGWGNFYLDMSRSLSTDVMRPSLPPLRSGVRMLGASDSPIGAEGLVASIRARPLVNTHGILMGAAFLLLFPVGGAAIRSGLGKSFKYHWVIQLVASGFVWAGAVLGVIMSRGGSFATPHQVAGAVLALTLGAQGLLGWQHHVRFIKLRRRTWISHAHIWLGRAAMLGGWANMLSGLVLSGHGRTAMAVGGLMGLEAMVMLAWTWFVKMRVTRVADRDGNPAPSDRGAENGLYFSIGQSEDEEDAEGMAADQVREEKPRKSMSI